jgi:hypothetical protein
VHRSIEVIIGRLITDDAFRAAFHRDAYATLERAAELGLALTPGEIRAVLATDRSLWGRVALALDARLKKVTNA